MTFNTDTEVAETDSKTDRKTSEVQITHLKERKMMMAAVFEGPGKPPRFKEMPRPNIEEPTDIVIRVRKTTICGTDLQILAGNVPQTKAGTILGHEGLGEVVELGESVQKHKIGDTVLIKCITACGDCEHCESGNHAFCPTGGWLLGTLIDGMQAEYARIPHADSSALPMVPGEREDAMIMAGDVLPNCYEIGLRCGKFPKKDGTTIAVIGTGPKGLATILCAKNDGLSPGSRIFAVDLKQSRLDAAKLVGATDLILNEGGNAVEDIMSATGGKGVDFVVECAGHSSAWAVCQEIVKMGGEISILGVHGSPVMMKLDKFWAHNISIHTGMVHCHTTPRFMTEIASGKCPAHLLLSHRFKMSQMEEAYRCFKNPGETGALKVVLDNDF